MAASLPRYDAKVRDKVQGCNQCNLNRIGFIQAITGTGNAKKYFIRWEEGDNYDEDGRGCQGYAKRGFVKYVPGENCGLRGSPAARVAAVAAIGGARLGGGGDAGVVEGAVESDTSGEGGEGSGDDSSQHESVGTEDAEVLDDAELDAQHPPPPPPPPTAHNSRPPPTPPPSP